MSKINERRMGPTRKATSLIFVDFKSGKSTHNSVKKKHKNKKKEIVEGGPTLPTTTLKMNNQQRKTYQH